MNSNQLHAYGLVDDRTAIRIALLSDGWTAEDAERLIKDFIEEAVSAQPRHWERYKPEEWTRIDEVIAENGGRLPKVAVTRPLAVELGRSHKSVLSAIERRIGTGR